MEKQQGINFNDLVSNNDLLYIKNSDDLSFYKNITSISNIQDYNIAFFLFAKYINVKKISHAYYLKYYLTNIFASVLKILIHIFMILSFLTLFLIGIDNIMKLILVFFIGVFFSIIYFYDYRLQKLEFTLSNLLNSKLLKPINFLLKNPTINLNSLVEKSIPIIQSDISLHILFLLKKYKAENAYIVNQQGVFTFLDIDYLLHSLSSHDRSYIAEELIKLGIYFDETKKQIDLEQSIIENNQNYSVNVLNSSHEENNITTQNIIDTNAMKNINLPDKNKVISSLWSKQKLNKDTDIEKTILKLYKPSKENLTNSILNLKKLM